MGSQDVTVQWFRTMVIVGTSPTDRVVPLPFMTFFGYGGDPKHVSKSFRAHPPSTAPYSKGRTPHVSQTTEVLPELAVKMESCHNRAKDVAGEKRPCGLRVVSNTFLFSPRKSGKISNLRSLFFRWVETWKHQPVPNSFGIVICSFKRGSWGYVEIPKGIGIVLGFPVKVGG